MKFKIQGGSLKAGQLIDAIVVAYLAGHGEIVVMDGNEVLGDVADLPEWARNEIGYRYAVAMAAKNGLTEKTVITASGMPVTIYSRPAAPSAPSAARLCP
jgi:hypothetical protein